MLLSNLHHTPRPAARRGRLGLSLVEIMVSLAITAALLTSAAAAFNASSAVIADNEQFFRATQAARVSLHQILTNVRRGTVSTASTSQAVRLITAVNDDGSGEDDVTYRFDATGKKLVFVTNDDATDPDYTMANNVTALAFDVQLGQDYTKAPCVARVNVSITVKVGKNSVTLTGSAAPRRNVVY